MKNENAIISYTSNGRSPLLIRKNDGKIIGEFLIE